MYNITYYYINIYIHIYYLMKFYINVSILSLFYLYDIKYTQVISDEMTEQNIKINTRKRRFPCKTSVFTVFVSTVCNYVTLAVSVRFSKTLVSCSDGYRTAGFLGLCARPTGVPRGCRACAHALLSLRVHALAAQTSAFSKRDNRPSVSSTDPVFPHVCGSPVEQIFETPFLQARFPARTKYFRRFRGRRVLFVRRTSVRRWSYARSADRVAGGIVCRPAACILFHRGRDALVPVKGENCVSSHVSPRIACKSHALLLLRRTLLPTTDPLVRRYAVRG